MQIDLDRVCFLVAEPERDHRCVHARVQERHGGGVTQDVRGDRLGADRGAALPRRDRVVGDKRATASRLSGRPRLVGNNGSSGRPRRSASRPAAPRPSGGERRAALLASLADTAHVGSRPEMDVAAAQPGQLGDPQPGLNRDQQHVIATAYPPAGVRSREQRVDLLTVEEAHHRTVARRGGMASTRAISAACSGRWSAGRISRDDYPQWTGRRIRIPLQGAAWRCELLRIITALPGMP